MLEFSETSSEGLNYSIASAVILVFNVEIFFFGRAILIKLKFISMIQLFNLVKF